MLRTNFVSKKKGNNMPLPEKEKPAENWFNSDEQFNNLYPLSTGISLSWILKIMIVFTFIIHFMKTWLVMIK